MDGLEINPLLAFSVKCIMYSPTAFRFVTEYGEAAEALNIVYSSPPEYKKLEIATEYVPARFRGSNKLLLLLRIKTDVTLGL